MTRTDKSSLSTPHRFFLAVATAALVLSACGGSDTVIGDTANENTVGDDTSTSSAPAAAAQEAAPDPAPTSQTASVTLSTGETFVLVPRSCETQATDPNSLLSERFFDLSARTADDEYRFSLTSAQAAASTEGERVIGGLTAERDENGVNPDVDYLVQGQLDGDPDVMIVVDGARVSGQVVLDAKFSRNKAFGETVTATFEFNCG